MKSSYRPITEQTNGSQTCGVPHSAGGSAKLQVAEPTPWGLGDTHLGVCASPKSRDDADADADAAPSRYSGWVWRSNPCTESSLQETTSPTLSILLKLPAFACYGISLPVNDTPRHRLQIQSVWVRVSTIAVNRHHELGNSYNEKYLIGDGLQFRGFGPHQGRAHSGMQTNKVLERRLGVLHGDQQTEGRDADPLGLAWASGTSKPTPNPQWHTFSNKATPTPNSATPYGPVGDDFYSNHTQSERVKMLDGIFHFSEKKQGLWLFARK